MLQADGFNNSNILADGNFHGGDSEDFYIGIGSMFAILAEPDQPDQQPANLSDTSSEAVPLDGVLGVPLLKHRRIALSWMVRKEANGLHCSRGILTDDQVRLFNGLINCQ